MTWRSTWRPLMIASVYLVVILLLSSSVEGAFTEARLIDKLLQNYSIETRPVINSSEPVNVNISLSLKQILSLDEKREVFTSVVWIEQTWNDQKLVWDPNDHDGINLLYLAADRIWTPDLYLYDLVGESHNMAGIFLGVGREMLLVGADGSVINYMPVKIETACHVDLTLFPFDTQTCTLTMGSWVFSETSLIYHLGPAPRDKTQPQGAWSIISITPVKDIYYEESLGTEYSYIHFHIKMMRNPLFYIVNLVIPSYLMSGVMLLSLFLPPECGERMSVGLTVFMSYSVFSLIMSGIVPDSARKPPIMCVLFIINMVLTLFTIAWTVFVIRVHNCASTWGPPPPWTKRFLCHAPNTAMRFLSRNNNSLCCKPYSERHRNELPKYTHDAQMQIDAKEAELEPEVGRRAGSIADGRESEERRVLKTVESPAYPGENKGREGQFTSEEILAKWKRLTRRADKICALIYLVCTLTGLMAMLVIARPPYTNP